MNRRIAVPVLIVTIAVLSFVLGILTATHLPITRLVEVCLFQ